MNSKSKKAVAAILSLVLVTGAVPSNVPFIKNASFVNKVSAATTIKYGDWEYIKLDNYSAEIYKYNGTTKDVIVPVAINNLSVKSISGSAFYNNKIITSVSLPHGISEIPNNAFLNASNLKTVTLPSDINKIGLRAFDGTSLSSISLPNSLEEIGKEAFRNTKLTSITLPPHVKTIGDSAFSGLKISTLTLPSELTTIGTYTFSDTNISSLEIPASVKNIKTGAFSNCANLSSVTFNGTCNLGDSIFRSCDKLRNINMNTTTFANGASTGAFTGCTNLYSINNISLLGHNSNGRPFFASTYKNIILQNFDKFDSNSTSANGGIKFFDEYLKAEIHYIATTETANCTTDAQKIKKLHNWVCNKVEYAYDKNGNPDSSTKNHVDSSVFLNDKTVCDGYARALTLLLREVGIEAYYLSGSNHAWTMVKLGNRYFHLDATHNDGSKIKTSHYLKSDTDIKKCASGHNTWEIEKPSYRFTYTIPSTLPSCNYSLGDVNMDGKVDNADVERLQDYLLNSTSIPNITLADINGDNAINILDCASLKLLINNEMF